MRGATVAKVAGVIAALAAVSAIALLPPVRSALQRFLEWIADLGPLGIVVLALAYVPATVLCVPGSALTMGAGFVSGLIKGTIAVSIGATLGASAAFLVGRTFARRRVEAWVGKDPRFEAVDRAIAEKGFKIVLLLRLSPVFPFTVLNYALSVTRISFRQFVLATWIGTLPGTVMYVYVGSALKDLADVAAGRTPSLGEEAFFVAGLIATVVATVVVTRTARRAMHDAAPALGDAASPTRPMTSVVGAPRALLR